MGKVPPEGGERRLRRREQEPRQLVARDFPTLQSEIRHQGGHLGAEAQGNAAAAVDEGRRPQQTQERPGWRRQRFRKRRAA